MPANLDILGKGWRFPFAEPNDSTIDTLIENYAREGIERQEKRVVVGPVTVAGVSVARGGWRSTSSSGSSA